ncbi:ABC transporter ATP-binding protein [Paenibacillus sp. PK3_47]|uniref:ABC transporter ATP-binding protein n=1 Tax=Paenibacillus sp. PK3_47 TaxID=2072642 RepID=UPI00201DFA75|nr:ABC transporter ATP-binding protein [Paenibacillus sp. PK3_47]UQZ36826.1 ABC transporter ATP-binding protein [Paenibacillus sp. PK3_47]
MISLNEISFAYDKNPVIKKLSFTEQDRVITGLWGRNGAGKTTLMQLISGHQKPDSGTVQIMGREPYNNPAAQGHLCYIKEDHPFSEIWSVRDCLRFYQYFKPNWNQEFAEQMLETFQLPHKKKTKKLSTGMKTALQLVIGLASQADVTILDEPTNGLDAAMRKKFYKLLLESYEAFPRLMLISTHQIEELQPLLDNIMVVHEGQLLTHEPMENLREMGIWLTGESGQVNQLTSNEKVIEESTLGSTKKVMIDAPMSEKWRERVRTAKVSIEKAHVQDYLLAVTENVKEASR